MANTFNWDGFNEKVMNFEWCDGYIHNNDKEYQEKKKALHVGDEVEFDVEIGIAIERLRGYITNLFSPVLVRVLTKKYGTLTVSLGKCKKTGKHSDEIERAMASFEKGEYERTV